MIKNLKALYQLFVKRPLPTSVELFEKSRVYAREECCLQNFYDNDEITIAQGHYCNGYQQAIKDFVNKKYKGLD